MFGNRHDPAISIQFRRKGFLAKAGDSVLDAPLLCGEREEDMKHLRSERLIGFAVCHAFILYRCRNIWLWLVPWHPENFLDFYRVEFFGHRFLGKFYCTKLFASDFHRT